MGQSTCLDRGVTMKTLSRRRRFHPAIGLAAIAVGLVAVATAAGAGPITITDPTTCPSTGPCTAANANPYPSTLTVAGGPASITDLNVTLDFTHDNPADIDMLLVGPGGSPSVVLMSDAGDSLSDQFSIVVDDSGIPMPDDESGSSFVDGVHYSPSNYGTNTCRPFTTIQDAGDTIPAATATTLAAFNGLSANGTWSLYVADDCGQIGAGGGGMITSWNLAFNNAPTAATLRSFAATPTASGVRLTWRTAQERDVLGFEVYRTAPGKAVRVNRSLVAARHSGTARGAAYRLVDRSVRGGAKATYRLRLVHLDGSRHWARTVTLKAR